MPLGVAALARLGVRPRGMPIRAIAYVDRRHRAVAHLPAAGLGVRRTELHRCLQDATDAAGIEVRAERVSSTAVRAGHVEVNGVAARFLIGADGLHSGVRDRAGLSGRPVRRSRRRYGMRAHFACRPWSDQVEVHWSAGCEAYVTPVGAECVEIALLGPPGADLAERIGQFPELVARLPDRPVDRPRGAGPLRQRARGVATERVLLVGDAAGYVDALTGEGLSIAFGCAAAVARCLRDGRPDRYAREHRVLTRRYRLLTGAVLAAAQQPVLRRGIVPAAARARPLFQAVVNQLAGQ